MKKIPLLIILGPTATGKSDLAVTLAKMIEKEKISGYVGAEIISADSRQVYRRMDIGTGKITRKEMDGIPHHLLDIADPRERFTVVKFKELADRAIGEIVARGRLPIICGGTGFYIDTLLNDARLEHVEADLELRKRLSARSSSQLFKMLEELDLERARKMNKSDSQNPRRLIRAIEIATAILSTNSQITDTKKMVGQQAEVDSQLYSPIFIGLHLSNDLLRERIKARLISRVKSGMLDEARKLHEPISAGGAGLSWERMDDLGLEYRYMARHLRGMIGEREMIGQLETDIWHYAKRQMTWFKRNRKIRWFEAGETHEIIMYIRQHIAI